MASSLLSDYFNHLVLDSYRAALDAVRWFVTAFRLLTMVLEYDMPRSSQIDFPLYRTALVMISVKTELQFATIGGKEANNILLYICCLQTLHKFLVSNVETFS
jgi:hypothetical protein